MSETNQSLYLFRRRNQVVFSSASQPVVDRLSRYGLLVAAR